LETVGGAPARGTEQMSESTLKRPFPISRAVNSTSVLVGGHVVRAALRIVNTVVLTRLLYPEAFAIVMLVVSVQFVMELLSDFGTKQYVLRADDAEEPRVLDTIWTFEIMRGAALTLVLYLLAGPIAAAMGEPLLKQPLQFASLVFLINGFRPLTYMIAQRHLKEWKNVLVLLGVYVVELCVTLTLAWFLRSYWAIIYGITISAALNVVAGFLFYPDARRRLAFDRRIYGNVWQFTRFLFASSILTVVIIQFDKFFVFRTLDTEAAGLYSTALNLVITAETLIIAYFSRIYLAEVSRRLREGQPKAASYYEPLQRMRAFFVFAAAAGIFLAPVATDILYEDRYQLAGVFASVLIIKSLLFALSVPMDTFFTADGRAHLKFITDIMRLIWIVGILPLLFVNYGVEGILWGVALVEVLPILFFIGMLVRDGILDLRREWPVPVALVAGLAAGAAGAATYDAVLGYFSAG
jgi:O-antigen/teichoic acid export membrane protein